MTSAVDESAPEALGPGGLQTLDRLAGVLFALADSATPLSTGELAARVGLPASSTYRLVHGLENQGLLARESRGSVSLGLRILELARRLEDHLERTLVGPSRAVMERLARDHGETALLTAPVGANSIGLASVDSPRPIRLSFARWRAAPLHRGASGKVLLAHLDGDAAERAIAQAHRIDAVDERALRDELATARERGYVVTHGELDPGAAGVAAPVRDRRGRLVAGLTVAGPSGRIDGAGAGLVDAVRAGATEVEAALAAPRAAH